MVWRHCDTFVLVLVPVSVIATLPILDRRPIGKILSFTYEVQKARSSTNSRWTKSVNFAPSRSATAVFTPKYATQVSMRAGNDWRHHSARGSGIGREKRALVNEITSPNAFRVLASR